MLSNLTKAERPYAALLHIVIADCLSKYRISGSLWSLFARKLVKRPWNTTFILVQQLTF